MVTNRQGACAYFLHSSIPWSAAWIYSSPPQYCCGHDAVDSIPLLTSPSHKGDNLRSFAKDSPGLQSAFSAELSGDSVTRLPTQPSMAALLNHNQTSDSSQLLLPGERLQAVHCSLVQRPGNGFHSIGHNMHQSGSLLVLLCLAHPSMVQDCVAWACKRRHQRLVQLEWAVQASTSRQASAAQHTLLWPVQHGTMQHNSTGKER